ncbi:MAG: glycosyltransferase family 4 protein [Acidobacteria bacterium]|nr:glycosyltransferase family 4 protein [Acidobacteriota bacterium]MCW5967300.1 glycosyltransferase family 4 protein [Blastocatellales bacterium]
MHSLKILQVCSAEHLGGGEHHVAELTAWLVDRGHAVHLAVRSQSPLYAMVGKLPVKWHTLPLAGAADLYSAAALARIIRKYRIDVIHGHVARDYPVCGVASKLTGARLFLTRHHFNPLKGGRLYGWTISGITRWLAVSGSVAAAIAGAFPPLAGRISIIPNWVDFELVGRVERNEARRRLGVGRRYAAAVIGQITPLKRQDLFLRAAAKVLGDFPELDLQLMIIGAAEYKDRDYEASLCALVQDLNLGDRVSFEGYRNDVRELYRGIDIVVVPSENEGFSLVIAEAMAAGCAVVASAEGPMQELIADGQTGVLARSGDSDSFAAAIAMLLTDSKLRGKMGEAASASTKDRFDRDRLLGRIEAIYQGHKER